MQKRKLQVFVSSTYKDLISERQAAVEAILSAGHIPAGMELFAAGDKSQWQVIKEWIEESDAYLLILGGRYGSIEKENGCIPGNQGVNGAELAEELARLGKENATLREKVAQFEEANDKLINGMPIEEFIKLLESEVIVEIELQNTFNRKELKAIRELADGGQINLFHGLRVLSRKIDGSTPARPSSVHKKLSTFGLIKFKKGSSPVPNLPEFTESGRQLFMYLLINGLILPKFPDDPKNQFL